MNRPDPTRASDDVRPGTSRSFELAFPKEIFLAAVERLAPGRPGKPGVTALAPYLEHYRADAFTEDFLSLTTEDAATLALDLWEFNVAHQDSNDRVIRVRPALAAPASDGKMGKPLRFDVAEIVGPDIAFLVDSAINACQEARVEIRAVLHPVMAGPNGKRSLIQIHLPQMDDAHRADLARVLEETFADVANVNADHVAMKAKMEAAAAGLAALRATPERSAEDTREARDFLNWLAQDHFTFLGARDYTYARGRRGELSAEEPIVDDVSGLGILRDQHRNVLSRGAEPTVLSPAVRAFLNEPQPLIVAKASFLSRVHRRAHADYVGVKRFDARGEVIGETRFVGLYTSSAYTKAASDVPLIRRKIEHVKQAFSSESRFAQRRLDAVLQTYPRDELFQISEEDLARIARGVLQLQIRPRTQLFIRRDRFDRYISALLYVPRDSYNSELRTRAHKILADAYGGRASAYYPQFSDGPLARVHLIVRVRPGHAEPDEDSLDLQMRQLFETWEGALGRFARSTNAELGPVDEARFTAAYKEMFSPQEGLADIAAIMAMGERQATKARAWGADFNANAQHLKIYHRDGPLDLSEIVPVLERMGLRAKAEANFPIRFQPRDFGLEPMPAGPGVVERPGFEAPAIEALSRPGPERLFYVHDLTLERLPGQRPLERKFEETFEAVFARLTENDRFNSLVVALGVDWRSAALLRTLARWRAQSGLDPSEPVQVQALRDYPEIATQLLKLFAIKFDPGMPGDIPARRLAAEPVSKKIDQLLDTVSTLDADRVLRRLTQLVRAVQRTNFYLAEPGQAPDRHIAVKIASPEADPLPAPRPFREIFVWSPDVEGVHLRFGPVARGGLRWSDRRDDFRTEVLGLVKAQQVKNAVIVPVGSKGGFFPKLLTPKATREEAQAIGIAAYKTFVGALLQLTDNIVDGKTVRPARLIAWDGDDPYLVVAADKGTAAFSDIANGLSADWKFWLGDAFASGGSVGYDHKKMGITARGAWEAVKRHFREQGTDIQTQPFRVVGIGDMSGDVFGNGMLLSKAINLVAAFDHRHIFLDPTPDAAASFQERQRMFELPRSSWADYNTRLISRGGGVFDRSAKAIPLSPEVRVITGLADDAVTPDQLIKALLQAECDLLWFGGIGTYIKASSQSNVDVGDKANDLLRVDARDLKAKVIGEGANLGLTQAARVEFARKGGRINTDAIDNSAGVDSSDHEVNIKILLSEATQARDLRAEDRNALLASMTDDVAAHVLRNNYDQTEALSVMEASAGADLDSHERFIESLESRGRLDRAVEGLPSPEQFRALRERAAGLTRPELAVIMAYAKLDLFDALIQSTGPDDPTFETLLVGYFPDELERFDKARKRHRLRREIIATRLSNRIINMTGPSFVAQKRDAEGVEPGRLARAVEAAHAVFHFDEMHARIDALDGKAPAAAQIMMLAETSTNLRMLASAFAAEQSLMDQNAGAIIERYRDKVREIRDFLPKALSPLVLSRVEARAERYRIAGAPEDLARDVAMVRALAAARETIDIAERTHWPLAATAYIQHETGRQLGLDRMRAAARDLDPRDHWDKLALLRVADDLPRQQGELAASAIAQAQKDGVPAHLVDKEVAARIVAQWIEPRRDLAARLTDPMGSFDRQGVWSLAKLVLLGDAVREFVYASRSEPAKAAARR